MKRLMGNIIVNKKLYYAINEKKNPLATGQKILKSNQVCAQIF